MDVTEYYRDLLKHRVTLLEACIADEPAFALHVASHNVLKDFDIILSVVPGPEQHIFLQAAREYQYSLEAVLYGNYRHAFSSLRLSFELFTGAIYFSAHRMKMNLWLAGGDDLHWAAVNDPDKGVYSHNFMKAFNPELGSYRTQYMNLASQVYRECSEYVHGNPATHENPALEVSYEPSKVRNYHDKVSTVRLCMLFQFLVRYLLELSHEEKIKIESLAMDSFGDLPEIQASFGAVGK
jgi:hypothetical protein